MDSGVTIVDPSNTAIDKAVRIGRDSVIHPFTVISGDTVVGEHCEVGPFAHLRAGTRLAPRSEVGNYTEVKNSSLGERSKAKHLSYLGDARIGTDVNIGAGTICANYDGKAKHVTTIQDGAFVGSGTVLVAPVTVGKGAVTGAGAVVLAGRDVKDGEVVVGVPARALTRAPKEDPSPGDERGNHGLR